MSIYAVYKSYDSLVDEFRTLKVPRFDRAVYLPDSPEQMIEHNGLRIPIGIAGHKVTFFVSRAEGNLNEGHLDIGSNPMKLSERDRELVEVVYNLRPFGQKNGGVFVIYGDESKHEPSLYIERHDRETRNFHPTPSRERE